MNMYTRTLRLKNKDVDLHRRLRTSTLFELLQEASIAHTEALGMGREKTLDKGLLWVVTLQRAEIARMPVYDETITLETWPGETMHVLFPRHYRVLTEDGTPLIRASALWALVDEKTRRVIFPARYGVAIDGMVTGNEIELPSPPRKAEAGSEALFGVPYSYVDLNGHMNNTRYFDLAEDHIPAAAQGRPLRLVETEYAGEALMGDVISIAVEESQDGEVFVSGDCGKKIFRMKFVYN